MLVSTAPIPDRLKYFTMPLTIPNLLTLLRILLIPVFVLVYYLPFEWANEVAMLVFALAAITDWFDGYLARTLGQESRFGAFLDPVADKLMVAVVMVVLVEQHPTAWFSIPAAVIIGREITVSALREWMAEMGERAAVKVSWVGKWKTTAQMAALLLLLWNQPLPYLNLPGDDLGMLCLYLATLLTLYSMFQYLRAAWPHLNETKDVDSA